MRVKLFQIGNFYVRFDLTIIQKFNVLLGFNYIEGAYSACTDSTFKDCAVFDYGEFQIGFLFFTLSMGREKLIDNGERTEDAELY